MKTVPYEEVEKVTHCVIYHIVCDNFEKGDIMSVHQCPLGVAYVNTICSLHPDSLVYTRVDQSVPEMFYNVPQKKNRPQNGD